MTSVAEVKQLIRRKRGPGVSTGDDQKRQNYSRNSTQTIVAKNDDTELGPAIGREGNNWPTPDSNVPLIGLVNGDRLQDFANTHLNEGEAPGRIPRFWNNRDSAKLGRSIDGNPSGDQGLALDITGQEDGGIGDAKYIQHLPVPRGTVIARAYARTVDDSANIPAVFVSDPARR